MSGVGRSGRRAPAAEQRFASRAVAILPQAAEQEALRLARRLQSRIVAAALALGEEPVHTSVGVARRTPGTGTETLLAPADRALPEAKRAGGAIGVAGGLKAVHLVADGDRLGSSMHRSAPQSSNGIRPR